MKAKTKGNPRRRLFWLLGVMVFLLGGYFGLPYAQDAFVNWWEDDPFTPLCDVPDYEIYRPVLYNESVLSSIHPNPVETLFPYYGSISPNGRWLQVDNYNPYQSHVYELGTNTISYSYNLDIDEGSSDWLYDSQLLYRQPVENSSYQSWFIYNLETQNLRRFPHVMLEDSYLISRRSLSSDNYFLTSELVRLDSFLYRELVLYKQDFSRLTFHRIPDPPGMTIYVRGELSPNGRYLAYKITNQYHNSSLDTVEWWLVDLEESPLQPVRLNLASPHTVAWSPDSAYLAYSEGETLNFYDVQTREVVETFIVPAHLVVIQEWADEGFWLIQRNQSSHETSLYWGNFDGDRLESRFVLKGYMELIRALEGTNTYFLNLYEDEGLVIINNNGEIEARLDNFHDWMPSQSPDNRYLSYFGDNNWLYLLDLETTQSCKVFETLTDQNSTYQWRIIPQEAE